MIKKLKTITYLFKTHAALSQHVKKSLEKTDFNLNEFAVMEALFTHENLTPRAIVDKILIPNSSLSYVLEQLHKKELITYTIDQKDKRMRHYALSEKGKRLFPSVYQKHYNYMDDLIKQGLDENELLTLQTLLKKLGHHAERSLQNDI